MILLTLLPLVFFGLVWLFFTAVQAGVGSGEVDVRRPLILAGLFCAAYLAVGTEILSLLGAMTTASAIGFWLAGIGIMGILQWRTRFFQKGITQFKRSLTGWKPGLFGWMVLIASLAALVVLLVTGLLSPPNVHDVLAYHMSRVMHWVQNQSLAFFPTPNTWQLWMPPFSELSQLQWYLLAGNDGLTFLPQWSSLILSMAAVSLTARRLGAKPKGQWLSALFVLTLPIIVLQASGRKNDIVLAFFYAALVYFVVESNFRELDWLDQTACGLSVGLGMLTKGTFPIFAFPFLVWLLVNVLKQSGWKQILVFLVLGLVCVLVLTGGHWVRNTLAYGNPIFSGEEGPVINARFGLRVTLSNLVRNSAVQLNGRYGFINEAVHKTVTVVHDWLNLPVFDPELTQGPGEFYYVPNREEVVGNSFHFAMAALSLIILLTSLLQKRGREERIAVLWLALSGLISFVLFSALFRWQSWGTRLVIPTYIAFAPVIGFMFSRKLPSPATWLIAIALGVVMVNPLLNNYSRSFSCREENRNCIWRLSRRGLLFANNKNIEGAVLALTDQMEKSGCRAYGILMRRNAPEYLLWGALPNGPGEYELRHIQVENESAVHASPDYDPCGIILFEMTDTNSVDQYAFPLNRSWQVGDAAPFSLFLKPGFRMEGLE